MPVNKVVVVEQLSSPKNSSSACKADFLKSASKTFVTEIWKWTESTLPAERTATVQRAAARHFLKSESGNFKRGRKKLLKMGCLHPLLCKIRSPCRSDILL